MKSVDITVIIPTFNRSENLSVALTSLVNQSTQDFEIIVVDNDVKGSAATVVRRFLPFPIVLIREPRLGHSFAKNSGLRKAGGKFCLFLDDDAKVDPDFVANALSIIKNRESPVVFGGPVKPYFPDGKPAWFKSSYEQRSFGKQTKTLSENEFLPTSSTFIATSLLKQIHGFDTNFGIKGSVRRFGEDTDVLRRIRQQNPGLHIMYFPVLAVWHATPAEKTTLKYRFAHQYNLGASGSAVSGEVVLPGKTILKALYAVAAMKLGFIKGWFFRNKNLYPYWQNYAYEKISPHMYWLGLLSVKKVNQ